MRLQTFTGLQQGICMCKNIMTSEDFETFLLSIAEAGKIVRGDLEPGRQFDTTYSDVGELPIERLDG